MLDLSYLSPFMKKHTQDRRVNNGRHRHDAASRLASAEAHPAPMTKLREMALEAGYSLADLARAAKSAGLHCSPAMLSMAAPRPGRPASKPMPRATAWFIAAATGYPISAWPRLSD